MELGTGPLQCGDVTCPRPLNGMSPESLKVPDLTGTLLYQRPEVLVPRKSPSPLEVCS